MENMHPKPSVPTVTYGGYVRLGQVGVQILFAPQDRTTCLPGPPILKRVRARAHKDRQLDAAHISDLWVQAVCLTWRTSNMMYRVLTFRLLHHQYLKLWDSQIGTRYKHAYVPNRIELSDSQAHRT